MEMDARRKPKKKKKNSRFMRNAKGFAKQGIYGRGTHIEDDQYNYFINILDAMKNGFEDTDQKVSMANNVFEQTLDQEIHLASNQIVCKVLETLIGYVEEKHLENFFEKFADNFRPICSDRFASHVLQKMVEIGFLRAIAGKQQKQNVDGDDEENAVPSKKLKSDVVLSEEQYNLQTVFSKEHRKNCGNFLLRVSKFTLNNLEDFVWDSCANHIMRTCILSLAGVHVAKVAFDKSGADMAKNKKIYQVSEEWHEIMKEFPQRLEMWPQFPDFPYQEHSSALISVICIALKVVDKNLLKHFGKKLLNEAFLKSEDPSNYEDNDDEKVAKPEATNEEESNVEAGEDQTLEENNIKLPMVFEYPSAVILLETLISLAGPKLLTQLYLMLFENKIAILAKEPSSNFAVQKLLQYIKEKEDFEKIFTELVDEIEDLLKIGHTGVVSSLSSACLRLASKQAQFIVAVQKALHVFNDKEKVKSFFFCLVKLKPYDILKDDKSNFVHLHGSLIIQHILQFNKPILLVNNILETPADQLIPIFNTPNGSHIVDAFLESKYIGAKSRERFIQHLDNFYIDLAMNKFGSRVVEKCFEAAGHDNQKQKIIKELSDKANMLKGSPFGRLLYNKFRIETYRLSATQWKAALQQKPKSTPEDLFKDIIN